MSSLIAHVAAGVTAWACLSPRELPGRPWVLAGCVLLAVLPDADYLVWWGMQTQLEPRYTHSAGFAILSALLCAAVLKRTVHTGSGMALAAAAASHPVLDMLVGVHAAPWLWPVLPVRFVLPIGLLPSAPRMDLANPLLWRNLALEAAVLGPVIAALVARARGHALLRPTTTGALLAAAWLAALGVSVSLPR